MSDPKRATLITVGAPKSAKNNVTKTVRLTINLDESNETKYPELNYKELVIAEERKKKVQNGKNTGLDPFSDNDDDVERVARKFEQKYGGKSTYGRKGRSKRDDFADIGAGYDENDSFIDNTDGYDEMIPPECDTIHGGFYINCGSLEFKTVPENQSMLSDGEAGNRRNKRRISSSSSEAESSESTSESESQDEKDTKPVANGDVDSHKTEHRKKKNKNDKKPKKVLRTDSSAATSGKQTSDENNQGDAESADSRTSQSDSLTSKPAPSSENAVTSDSSRDIEPKVEVKQPVLVSQCIEELEAFVSRILLENSNATAKDMEVRVQSHLVRLHQSIQKSNADTRCKRIVWTRVARLLNTSRAKLLHRVKALCDPEPTVVTSSTTPTAAITTPAPAQPLITASPQGTNNKRKACESEDNFDISNMGPVEREAKIVETLQRLKVLIDEKEPVLLATYVAECERVKEERRKLQTAGPEGGAVERRLPKRRFPWCARSRALLAALVRLAASREHAARLLVARALPLFPDGFVRKPTLLRQASLNKEIVNVKRPRLGSGSQPATAQLPTPVLRPEPPSSQPQPSALQATQTQTPAIKPFSESIQFPSSLTVITTTKNDKVEAPVNSEQKSNSIFGNIMNSFSLNKDIVIEKDKKKEERKEDSYVPNNIGSITITPVPHSQKAEKKTDKSSEPLIRIKSPADLNDMVSLKKEKKKEKLKKVETPLHIDTSYQPKRDLQPSPKSKPEEITQKQIESMKISENNIPKPVLVPVRHSPTFAKPINRPPEVKKKKEVLIVSDLDPLGDVNSVTEINSETLAVDDSSSDVEVIEDIKNTDKSELKISDKSDSVPLKDKVCVRENHKKVDSMKHSSKDVERKLQKEKVDEPTADDINTVMRNLREMENSQEQNKFSNNSFGGVITSERTSLNKMDGCNGITTG